MNYKDKLRRASFRGVCFEVEKHEAGFGRRTAIHEYPARDLPYTEDLGRKARSFTIEGFIIGNDYSFNRDRLITACEMDEPGSLVHPYLGTKKVVCTECKIKESSEEGRITRFSMTLIEAGLKQLPAFNIDYLQKITAISDRISSLLGDYFTSNFSILDMPAYVVGAAMDLYKMALDAIDGLVKGITVNIEFYADIQFELKKIRDKLPNKIYESEVMANGLGSLFKKLTDTNEIDFSPLFSFGDEPTFSTNSTITSGMQKTNQKVLTDYIRTIAVVSSVKNTVTKSYDTYDEAVKERSKIAYSINERMEEIPDDEIFSALQELKSDLLRAVPEPNKSLPRIATHEINQTVPSLVLAYDLYGSLDLEKDIIRRNKIDHPGFIKGGQILEVVSAK